MKIIGYHIDDSGLTTSEGEYFTDNLMLHLLDEQEDAIRIFYHLDYSVAKLLVREGLDFYQCEKLFKDERLYWKGYTIQYYPHKLFSLTWGAHGAFANYADAAQYIQYHRFDIPTIEAAKEAQAIGEKVYRTLVELELEPKSLTSPIATFEKGVMRYLDLPTVDDIPEGAAEYAYECCHGGWLEAFQKGHFDSVYDYDITSAYPFYTSMLLDTRHGQWKQGKDYCSEAAYGYCKGIVTIDSEFSPIFYSKGDITYTPVGIWETVLTKAEIDFITKYGLGKFDIEYGWWWIPDKMVTPLYDIMTGLYNDKEQRTGLEKEVVKRIMAGIWGKFLELRGDELGPHFNPVWGAEVETRTRLNVARFVIDNCLQPYLLSIAVDGVVASCPATTAVDNNGEAMGMWKLTAHCPAFIVSSGVIAVKDKNGNGDFGLRYDWLKEEIEKKPRAGQYRMKKLSPITLGKAMKQKRFTEMGNLEEITKTVDIEYEQKRCYEEKPRHGRDLLEKQYSSSAWDVSLVDEL